jgi:hypothetical protein
MAVMRGSVLVLALCAACGGGGDKPTDGPPADDILPDTPPDGNPLMPDTLAGTGLCANAACDQFMPGVWEYTPQYPLWSDTATKRRWISLPPGTTIDTTDMDYWKFPVGTKLWKEFTRDGVRVETRYIVKLLDDDAALNSWFFVPYQWNATQDATTAVPMGVTDANGTGHDIPSRTNCKTCHNGLKSRVLGFGAISLDYQGSAGQLDLDDLIAMGLLSAPPAGTAGTPRFPLPGTATQQQALGYMHANCGHCHNPTSATYAHTPLVLRLETAALATVQATPAYTTSYNVMGSTLTYPVGGPTYTKIIKPNDVANSILHVRFNATTSPPRMPELGTEMIDPTGVTLIDSWIGSL